ncbi:MAG: hypothetical protein WBP47_08435 [Candidatus Promineifilaceae bacterium]
MPQFRTGDMWTAYETAGLFLITTNSTLTTDGRLVMGRGIARQARDRFPGLDAALGAQIRTVCGSGGFYGLLISRRWPAAKLAAFQVKYHWRGPADFSLITRSAIALTWWARYHADCPICLNFPGIGNGGLARTAVLPLLAELPDNVTIWEVAAPPARIPEREDDERT